MESIRVQRTYEVTLPDGIVEALEKIGHTTSDLLYTCTEYVVTGDVGRELYLVEYINRETGEKSPAMWGNFNDVMIGNCDQDDPECDTIILYKIDKWDAQEVEWGPER